MNLTLPFKISSVSSLQPSAEVSTVRHWIASHSVRLGREFDRPVLSTMCWIAHIPSCRITYQLTALICIWAARTPSKKQVYKFSQYLRQHHSHQVNVILTAQCSSWYHSSTPTKAKKLNWALTQMLYLLRFDVASDLTAAIWAMRRAHALPASHKKMQKNLEAKF